MLGQILAAVLIMLAAFGGLMMLIVDFNDPLQCYAAEVGSVRRYRVFTSKLLAAATSVSQHLSDVMRKLVRPSPLIARQGDCLRIAPSVSRRSRSLIHDAPVIQN